jgi:hypothetical protein
VSLRDDSEDAFSSGVAEIAIRSVMLALRRRACLRLRRHALAPQLVDSRADYRKIVGGAGSGHVPSV